MPSAGRENKLIESLRTGRRSARLAAARDIAVDGTMATIARISHSQEVADRGFEEGPYVATRLVLAKYPTSEIARHVNDRKLSVHMRLGLLRELELRKDRSVAKLLLPVLPGGEDQVRLRVAQILGTLGDGTLVKPLTKALGAEDARVREAAALALGMLASPKAIGALLNLIDDPDPRAAYTATMALGMCARETRKQGRDIWYQEVRGRQGLEWLIRAAGSSAPALRAMGSYSLAEVGIDRETVIEAITTNLQDDDTAVRRWAAYACGKLRARGAAAKLRDLLDDPRSTVRAAAVQACGELSDRQAMSRALGMLHDRNDRVRLAAERALEKVTYHVYERESAAPSEGKKVKPPVVHWRAWWQENGEASRDIWLRLRVGDEIAALESPKALRRQRAIDFLYSKTRQRHEFVADGPREKRLDAIRAWRVWWARYKEKHPVDWLIEGLRSHDEHRRRACYLDLKRITKGLFVYDAYAPASRRQEGIRNIEAWWTKNRKLFIDGDSPL